DKGAGVDDVLVGVFGGGAVGGFEAGVAGDVVDVSAGGDADAADLGGQRIAEIVAVEVGRGDDVEIFGACEDLLKRDVGNRVLDDQSRARFAFGDLAPRPAVDFGGAEKFLGDFVSPVTEGAFRELHNVPLVHQRDALALVLDRVADGAVDQAFG